MKMQSYFAIIRNDRGGTFRATVQARNHYEATQMFRAQYGSMMLTEGAAYIPGSDVEDDL